MFETTTLYAILGGILPALLWVWFWNKEDARRPEPLRLLALAFIAGMVTVAVVIPLERVAMSLLSGTLMVLVWAAIEEVSKFVLAYITVLRRKESNEPIDPLIYMITVALGFAAVENVLFLINPLSSTGFLDGLLTGNFRFLGATLLHVLASSVVGVAMSFAFYRTRAVRSVLILFGVILATLLHGVFNFFILHTEGAELMRVFAFVWLGLIALLLIFERIKKIKRPLFYSRKK